RAVKNSTERSRSFTGRLTKIFVDMGISLFWVTDIAGRVLPLGSLLGHALAHAVFPVAEFRGERGAEVVGFEDLPDLKLDAAIERRLLEPLDDFVLGTGLHDPEARDKLLRFGEWAIDDGLLPTFEPDLCALRCWVE